MKIIEFIERKILNLENLGCCRTMRWLQTRPIWNEDNFNVIGVMLHERCPKDRSPTCVLMSAYIDGIIIVDEVNIKRLGWRQENEVREKLESIAKKLEDSTGTEIYRRNPLSTNKMKFNDIDFASFMEKKYGFKA